MRSSSAPAPTARARCATSSASRRALRLRQIAPALIYKSGVTAQRVIVPDDVLAHCRDIGATLAAGVDAGIY